MSDVDDKRAARAARKEARDRARLMRVAKRLHSIALEKKVEQADAAWVAETVKAMARDRAKLAKVMERVKQEQQKEGKS